MFKKNGNGKAEIDGVAIVNLLIKMLGFAGAAIAAFYITIGSLRADISDATTHRSVIAERQCGIERRLSDVEIAISGIIILEKKIDSLIIVLQ